jgi:transcriptional regulator with XRE-family HTH domain
MPGLNIGNHIRRLRLEQRRTQQEIADACGFTKSLLSKIESNKVVPPVATLVKIATALGTKVSLLIEAEKNVSLVVATAKEVIDHTVKTERGYWIFPFATRFQGKRMQPFLFVARKGEVKEHHLAHEGEEFMYVLEGVMKVQVDSSEWTLRAGDSIYFNSTQEHQVIPVSKTVKYLNMFA